MSGVERVAMACRSPISQVWSRLAIYCWSESALFAMGMWHDLWSQTELEVSATAIPPPFKHPWRQAHRLSLGRPIGASFEAFSLGRQMIGTFAYHDRPLYRPTAFRYSAPPGMQKGPAQKIA